MASTFVVPEPGTKVLLINSHAYDIRLPWAQWHQPTGLLQLGSLLRRHDCDVRFIDCLQWDKNTKVTRRKLYRVDIENYEIDVWRFGTLWGHLTDYVNKLKKEGWIPEIVLVSCFQTTWWQAAKDLIYQIKHKWFSKAAVYLGGVYASLEPEHAANFTEADYIIDSSVNDARHEIPDFSLYPAQYRPLFAGVYLYKSQNVIDIYKDKSIIPRDPKDIVHEISEKKLLGVNEFIFVDEEISPSQVQHFKEVLREVHKNNLGVRFVALGNISPEIIDGELAALMRKAGYRQVYLKSQVFHFNNRVEYPTSYEAYEMCVNALYKEALFEPRSGDVTAMLQVGNPHEDIEAVTERLVKLSSIVGVVNLVQYQYSRKTDLKQVYSYLNESYNSATYLSDLNCKFYPLARKAGKPFAHYIELTRLASLLSSKYRGKTFDFLEVGFVANAVRHSIETEGWKPMRDNDLQGGIDIIPLLPMDKGK